MKDTPQGVAIRVRVVPRASRTELAGFQAGALRIRVTSPPLEGRANGEVIAYLARRLKVPPSRISLTAGEKARVKTLVFKGMGAAELKAKLLEAQNG